MLIPRVMHHIWIGPDPLPAEFAEYRSGWRRLHPDWQHQAWGNRNAREHMTPGLGRLWDHAERIAPGSVEQFRSDLLRYELLLRYGGVYVDADFEPRRPLDALVAEASAFAAWETDGVWVNNAILGAVPGHDWLRDVVYGLPRHAERMTGRGYRPNKISGPQYITPLYLERYRGSVTVFPSALFYPYLWSELDRGAEEFPEAYAVHHWNNRRRMTEGART